VVTANPTVESLKNAQRIVKFLDAERGCMTGVAGLPPCARLARR